MRTDTPENVIEILADDFGANYFEVNDTSFIPESSEYYQPKDGVLILDSSGIIQEISEAACDMMGFDKEELLGISIEYFFIEAFFFIKGILDKSKASSIIFEKTLFNFDRHIIYAEITIYALGHDKIFVVIKDNSACKKSSEEHQKIFEELKFNRDLLEEQSAELVRLSEQLSESEERLKESIIEKDKFFSIMAHDIKSPFSGLLGLSSILCEEFDSLGKEKIKEYLVHMDNLIKNQYRLVENLLDWSRLQSGKMRCDPVKISILDSLNYVLELISQNAKNKSIRLFNNAESSLCIKADDRMLNSVLENLLTNAIKFTPTGGKISIDTFQKNNYLVLMIKDSGVGIESSILQNIFRIDVTHSTFGTENEKGTGLGLIICKEMIEKMDGSIVINSKPGKGTEAIIKLPIWKTSEI
jgi:signal transduction histidine kinase